MNRQQRKRRYRSRRAVAVLLSATMLLTLAPTTTLAAEDVSQKETDYSDVAADAWYKDAVDYVSGEGLLLGTDKDKFGPDTNVTRAMVVTVLWRQSGAPVNDGSSSFNDVVSGQWYSQAVAWGAKSGMVAGLSDTVFGPSEPVTREQLVAFMLRFAEKQGEDVSISDKNVLDTYKDAASVSEWAKNAIIWGLDKGVITGMTADTVAPKAHATRAQYAAILQRTGATISDDLNLSDYDVLTYYHNGEIITVDETNGETETGTPVYAKAVLAGDGTIVAVAYTDKEVAELEEALSDVSYEDVDLRGETMIPAFVDAHGHIDMTDQFADASPSSGVPVWKPLLRSASRILMLG